MHEKSTRYVRFAHYTVEEFLQTREGILVRAKVAQTCLSYLAFDVFEEPCASPEDLWDRGNNFNFGHYAAENWANHVRGELESVPQIQRNIFHTFATQGRRDAVLQFIYGFKIRRIKEIDITWNDYPEGRKMLPFLADFGLASMCGIMLRWKINFELVTSLTKIHYEINIMMLLVKTPNTSVVRSRYQTPSASPPFTKFPYTPLDLLFFSFLPPILFQLLLHTVQKTHCLHSFTLDVI